MNPQTDKELTAIIHSIEQLADGPVPTIEKRLRELVSRASVNTNHDSPDLPTEQRDELSEILDKFFIMRAATPDDDLTELKARNEAGTAKEELMQLIAQA